MELKKKIGVIILFIIAIILFWKQPVYAGYQEWESLNYDVTLDSDGSMEVIETWNVYVSDTNTLFKDFEIGDSDNYEITDVLVTEVIDGKETSLTQINEEQYHVDPGCYYGLQIDDSTFEIAWHAGLEGTSDTRTYRVCYTVKNAVKSYNDCDELYWQFLSDENTMTGKNVTGIIKLPRAVSDQEKLRVWGHGDYNAEIYKISNAEVSFSLDKLNANTMLEIRIVSEEGIFPASWNLYDEFRLEEILAEEKEWAEKANEEREAAKQMLAVMKLMVAGAVIVNILILLACLSKRKKYKEIGIELKERYSNQKIELEYFRDIPNEKNATPAIASYMYNFKNNTSNIENSISKIFSATILDLSLKGIIGFEMVSEKEVRITRGDNNQEKIDKLSEDEKIIYKLLNDAMLGKDYITPKEFSKYASQEYDIVYARLNNLDDEVQKYEKEIGNISEERLQIYKKWNNKYSAYLVFAIISCVIVAVLPSVIIGLGLLAAACRKNALSVSVLSEKGIEEVAQWKGLKKYMEEYSMLDEKLVPDIVLWEKYLVYATTFGISKKVIEQLKSVHPEMFEGNIDSTSNLNRYAYWHMMTNSSFGNNSFDDFSKSLEKVYTSARSAYNVAHSSSSSGSGGGGGFSGGGGGRRRRWKLRRSLKDIYSK